MVQLILWYWLLPDEQLLPFYTYQSVGEWDWFFENDHIVFVP